MMMDNRFQLPPDKGLLNVIARKEEEEENGIWKIVVGHNVDYTTTYSQISRQ
jgi:hypothetical protein